MYIKSLLHCGQPKLIEFLGIVPNTMNTCVCERSDNSIYFTYGAPQQITKFNKK